MLLRLAVGIGSLSLDPTPNQFRTTDWQFITAGLVKGRLYIKSAMSSWGLHFTRSESITMVNFEHVYASHTRLQAPGAHLSKVTTGALKSITHTGFAYYTYTTAEGPVTFLIL